jgi:hypothetical protein
VTPALYEVAPVGEGDSREATGIVYHFCSEAHRSAFEAAWSNPHGGVWGNGFSDDFITGTVCDRCGVLLEVSK